MKLNHLHLTNVMMSMLAGLFLLSISNVHAQELEIQQNNQATEEASPAASPSPSPTTEQTTVTTVSTRTIEGEVLRVQNNTVTVETNSSETVDLRVTDDIQITRDGLDAQVADIKPGDEVRAVVDENTNEVVSLEATSQDNLLSQEWLIPAIIAGLILIGIIYWLIRRANRQRIRTTTTNL